MLCTLLCSPPTPQKAALLTVLDRSICPSHGLLSALGRAYLPLFFYSWADFLHILASPRYASGTIAVNVTWMEMLIKHIAACTHLSSTVSQ